jgi:hypothetical protein
MCHVKQDLTKLLSNSNEETDRADGDCSRWIRSAIRQQLFLSLPAHDNRISWRGVADSNAVKPDIVYQTRDRTVLDM